MRELKNKLKKMKKVERERDVNEITRWVMSKWKEISEGEVNQDWRLKSALVKMVNTRFKVRDRRKMRLSDAQVDIGERNWSQMSTISRPEHRRDRGETFIVKSKWCLANEHWRKELKSDEHNIERGLHGDQADHTDIYHYQHSLAGWLAGTDGRGQLGDLQDCEDQ